MPINNQLKANSAAKTANHIMEFLNWIAGTMEWRRPLLMSIHSSVQSICWQIAGRSNQFEINYAQTPWKPRSHQLGIGLLGWPGLSVS